MAFHYTKNFFGYLYVQGTPQGEDIRKVRGLGSYGSLVWSPILRMSPQWSITHMANMNINLNIGKSPYNSRGRAIPSN
jgi:hypothetical protein